MSSVYFTDVLYTELRGIAWKGITIHTEFIVTLWLFNIAMENGLFMYDFMMNQLYIKYDDLPLPRLIIRG
jgi:hypothetical protein